MVEKENNPRTATDDGAEPDDATENDSQPARRADPQPDRQSDRSHDRSHDLQFQHQVQRLYQLTVYTRWLVVGLLWLAIAPFCLWHLRSEFALWQDYFTWTAVRYTIAYNRFATVGLVLCLGMTISTIGWQSRYRFCNLPDTERKRLENQVLKIRRKGRKHLLWQWVCSR